MQFLMECSFIKCWLPHAQYGENEKNMCVAVEGEWRHQSQTCILAHNLWLAYYVHNFEIFVPIKVRFMTLDSTIHCSPGAVTPPARPNGVKGMIAHIVYTFFCRCCCLQLSYIYERVFYGQNIIFYLAAFCSTARW